MDHWAPVVRYAAMGTAGFTADVNNVSNAFGPWTPNAGSGADNAVHATAADKWQNAYGEVALVALGTAGSMAGLWLRVVDTSNHYRAYLTPTNAVIEKVVAGVTTTLYDQAITLGSISSVASYGIGPVFRAEVNGDTIAIFWRGVLITSVSDTSLAAPGWVSMFLRAAVSTLQVQAKRFEAGPLTASYAGQTEQQAGPRRTASRLR